ncbi:HXXEE domain-containing protein [Hungatella hathewayi]|uniref:HXXEE domain-containing protein n=1 Tax=Hungatella hathewayi TaxID=154046 RepID=UPI003564DA19
MKAIVWLLPLLFILHDMEEIILAIPWKNSEAPKKRFIQVRFVPFGTFFNTESFSIAVCEELLLLTLVSAFGYFTGAITALLTIVPCCLIFLNALHLLQYPVWKLILSVAAGTVVAAVNMKLLHQCGEVFTDYVSSFFR